MYYSSKQFCDYAMQHPGEYSYILDRLGLSHSRKSFAILHKQAMHNVEDRIPHQTPEVWKWTRPWKVVPELRDFRAPEEDFGVGVEIELGFNSSQAAKNVASKVKHWRHITLDFEGGTYPIEATFPPMLYSKLNSKSQPCRYLKLVENEGTVVRHNAYSMVGIHVNVSVGGRPHRDRHERRSLLNRIIEAGSYDFTSSLQEKYFGREPYGGIRSERTHYECKMFNSTTDWKVLRRYIDISVELVKLLESNERITFNSVVAACERGYTLR